MAGDALELSADVYDTDPAFWDRQAALAGTTLRVRRATGGVSETYANGGYAHVCTRQDLAGARPPNPGLRVRR